MSSLAQIRDRMSKQQQHTLPSALPDIGRVNLENTAPSKADERKALETTVAAYETDPDRKSSAPEGVPDLTSLSHLDEDEMLYQLQVRYDKQHIYTYVASILIAINPYEKLPIYDEFMMNQYRGASRAALTRLAPHCYAVAETAYQNLGRIGKNQSMVICGESGSGKTETAKVFMQYLAHVTKGQATHGADDTKVGVEDQFLQVNPILEAFGNATTNMNNNSSRFAKFTQVLFNCTNKEVMEHKGRMMPRIAGSFVETYLLEKSRVSHQEKGERNYHVFYQLCRGADDGMRKHLALYDDMTHFYYLSQSGTTEVKGTKDDKNFKEMSDAFRSLGLSDDELQSIFAAVAGILHLGNINFSDEDPDEAKFTTGSDTPAKNAARLFGIDAGILEARMTTQQLTIAGEIVTKALKPSDATFNRDAMAKALYQGLFDWIVRRINERLHADSTPERELLWIGILDVFGFESSDENNSFEQFCINFANEKLQNWFNFEVIGSEQEAYLREGIPWVPLDLPENRDTIDMIEAKGKGLIAILDSTCIMPKGSDIIFLDNLFNEHSKNAKLRRARSRRLPKSGPRARNPAKPDPKLRRGSTYEAFNGFTVQHYAGPVVYNADGFIRKNMDRTNDDTIALFQDSKDDVVKTLLSTPKSIINQPGRRRMSRSIAFESVGNAFSKQLAKLLRNLQSTQPHFVRCVNPNQFKRPRTFDGEYVTPQLRCGGLVEAVRVLKLGYPSRVSYDDIFSRYASSMTSAPTDPGARREFVEAVFLVFGFSHHDYQLGFTKVFFKPGKQTLLDQVFGKDAVMPDDFESKIRHMIQRKRWLRVFSGVLMCVRVQRCVVRMRANKRLAALGAQFAILSGALMARVKQARKNTALHVLQGFMKTRLATAQQTAAVDATSRMQRFLRHCVRRRALTARLVTLVDARKTKMNAAAVALQSFFVHNYRRATLGAELAHRSDATKKRVELEKQLEAERAQAEEARVRQLEAERAKREAEEAARRREAEEHARKEEEERQRQIKARQEREEKEAAAAAAAEAARLAALAADRQAEEAAEQERLAKLEKEAQARREAADAKRADREAAAEKERQWQEHLKKVQARKEQEEKEAAAKLEAEEKEKANEAAAKKSAANAAARAADVADTPAADDIPDHIRKQHLDERKLQADELASERAANLRNVVLQGGKFMKHGRRGNPHIRHVCVSAVGNLHWSKRKMDQLSAMPSNTYIKLKDVIKVLEGKHTANFQRKTAREAPANVCFSIVSTERTLDLQAINESERATWVAAIRSVVKDVQTGMVNLINGDRVAEEHKQRVRRAATMRKRNTVSGTGQVRASMMTLVNFGSDDEKIKFLEEGGFFLKFERETKPHLLHVSVQGGKLYWGGTPKPHLVAESHCILLKDVKAVHAGKTTMIFRHKSTNALSPPEHCFSILFNGWTMDLQTDTNEHRNHWVSALSAALAKYKGADQGGKLQPGSHTRSRSSSALYGSGRLQRSQSMRLPTVGRRMSGTVRIPSNWSVPEISEVDEDDSV
jgi:myosin heavy subunit